jgi:anhydro-N-acetylmuramic acid kinase
VNQNQNQIDAIGVMSGTSLDGLDIAACRFFLNQENETQNFQIFETATIPIPWNLINKVKNPSVLSGIDCYRLNRDFGQFIGNAVKSFLLTVQPNHNFNPKFIASHGHTLFHRPLEKLTVQIGSPSDIAAICQLPVVADFRVLDVAHNGQGAPLVPLGDQVLFNQFKACLNLGGFSNISIKTEQNNIVAFDIGPCNVLLNYLAQKLGEDYDKDGLMAAEGKPDFKLIEQLMLRVNRVQKKQSLGREWFEEEIKPLFTGAEPWKDKLATATSFIATTIANILNDEKINQCLISGGGAFNNLLVKQIQSKANTQLVLPETYIITHKEALVFAWLGLQRWLNRVNVNKQYTGATKNTISGTITLV